MVGNRESSLLKTRSLLTAAFILAVGSVATSFAADANTDAAEQAYKKALVLQDDHKPAEAEVAFKKVLEDYPGTFAALKSLQQIYIAHAWAGRLEEAFQSWMKWKEEDLKRLGKQVPKEGPELSELLARARLDLADFCFMLGSVESLNNAKAQLEKLVKDYPQSSLVGKAREMMERVDREMKVARVREKEREEILKVVKVYEDAFNKGDAQTLLSLLAPSADNEREAGRLRKVLDSERYRDHIPYSYRVLRVTFGPKLDDAKAEAEFTAKDLPEGNEPRMKIFLFLKVGDAWKLRHP